MIWQLPVYGSLYIKEFTDVCPVQQQILKMFYKTHFQLKQTHVHSSEGALMSKRNTTRFRKKKIPLICLYMPYATAKFVRQVLTHLPGLVSIAVECELLPDPLVYLVERHLLPGQRHGEADERRVGVGRLGKTVLREVVMLQSHYMYFSICFYTFMS